MNIYVLLVGGFLIILMVLFGNNPIEEAKKKRKLECNDDPVVCAIQQHYKDNPYSKGAPSVGGGVSTGVPGGYQPPGGPNAGMGYPNPYQSGAAPAQPESQNYYPPAAPGVPASPLQQNVVPLQQQ